MNSLVGGASLPIGNLFEKRVNPFYNFQNTRGINERAFSNDFFFLDLFVCNNRTTYGREKMDIFVL